VLPTEYVLKHLEDFHQKWIKCAVTSSGCLLA
jgi:hypothetical protein